MPKSSLCFILCCMYTCVYPHIMSLIFSCKNVTFSFFIFVELLCLFAEPISFSISDFGFLTENILYESDAKPHLGNVELTPLTNKQFRVGRCIYSKPFHLWDYITQSPSHFTTTFSFGINSLDSLTFSGGFAFFLAPIGHPILPNAAGSNLGLFNSTTRFDHLSHNQIVMVEFDTLSNGWDPPGPHVGINVNKISSVVDASWDLSGANSRKEVEAHIAYNASTNMLRVSWTSYQKDSKPASSTRFNSLPYQINLLHVLPEQVTFGFSASNGHSLQNAVITSWTFDSSDHITSSIMGTSKNKKKSKHALVLIAVGATVPLFILMLGVIMCRLVLKRQVTKIKAQGFGKYNAATLVASISTHLENLALPRRFSYQELAAATLGFADHRRLGKGGSGQVYKGVLQDLGQAVAVKRIYADQCEHFGEIFVNEVTILSRLIHKNLVQFIGWCHEQGKCLLLYAYMPNSSLDTHLFGSGETLRWDLRYKIALGLLSALHYLHEEAEQCVLHRDIKSVNVLLDNDFSTKLGDFGIARLVDPLLRTKTTRVVGTFGYMAPEYVYQGKASKESDIFSFGVVALEIACGRQTYQDGEYHIPFFGWVWQLYLAGNILDVADERLKMKFDPSEMKCLLTVGLWCTHPCSKERPKAGQVIKVLQLEAPLPELVRNRHYNTD